MTGKSKRMSVHVRVKRDIDSLRAVKLVQPVNGLERLPCPLVASYCSHTNPVRSHSCQKDSHSVSVNLVEHSFARGNASDLVDIVDYVGP
jgi:hypothetical protein